jgi:hypothetical protein
MTVFSGNIGKSLKKTLDKIVDDSTDGVESNLMFPKYMEVSSMSDQWMDDQEYGGPGLVSRKPEGSELATGTIREGVTTRYTAETFGMKLIVTEEAIEDSKYDRVINAAKRLKRALYKTCEFEASNRLVRAFSASYPGADGVALVSTAHTLPHGGTFSNKMATAMSPSRAAVIVATTAIKKLPGHDGVVEGFMPKKVVCPVDQWAVWDGLTLSKNAPEAGQFNEINVVERMNLEVVPVQYWDNTTTNYVFITDCENGLRFMWRRKPKGRSWVENSQEVMNYSCSARWATGWTDPRAVYGVEA